MSVGELTNRVRQNYTRGVLSQQISAAALTATSVDFTAIPEVLQGDQFAVLALDPDAIVGAPELAKITEHAAGSDTIIIERGHEDTGQRLHPVATIWRLVSSADDFALIEQIAAMHISEMDLALTGYLPLAGGTMTGDLAMDLHTLDMEGGQVKNVGDPVDGTAAVSQDWADARYLTLSGTLPMTAPLNMAGQKILNLAAPTDPTDALNLGHVQTYYSLKTHVHAASDVTSGVFSTARIPNLNADTITAGIFADARIPGLDAAKISSGVFGTGRIPDLPATRITSQTFDPDRIPNLSANTLTSGTLPAGRLPSNVELQNTLHICSGLRFDTLPTYETQNGSLRWMGVNVSVGQSHTGSSLDYKEDVGEIDLVRSVFSRLNPIHFRYRADHPFSDRYRDWDAERHPDTGRMGLAYEEVAEVAPEWVYDADGMKAVSYEGMLPDLIADYLALRRLVLSSLGV